jgi:predicted AAA+ superfamily ATPase
MYVKRTITDALTKVSEQFAVILITGPRQIGKTTCLQHSADSGRTYVTLDDPQVRELAIDDPKLFMQRFSTPILIDEIQYAPQLLPLIKMAVDAGANKGDYWLTGSQQFHLMEGVSESLAGRVCILQMLGFSHTEMTGQTQGSSPFFPSRSMSHSQSNVLTLPQLYERIWRGCFPAIVTDQAMDRDLFYSSYVQTYLQRDVRKLVNVGDEISFMKFLRGTAARTGQLLNVAELGRDAGVTHNTAKRWLGVLQASGLVYLLEPYHNNRIKRMVKTPKLYFMDTGLAAYLTQWTSPETLEAGAASGAFFETWAVTEIIKSYWHHGKVAPIYFYRDTDQREVDMLIVQDGQIFPVEFKKTAMPKNADIRHFSVLEKLDLPIGDGAVICLTDSVMPINETVTAINVGQI